MNYPQLSITKVRMDFNEITIKTEPEDFACLEPGQMDIVGDLGTIKIETPEIEIKNEPIEDVGDSASPVKVFECPNCPQEISSLNR